jgi:hypothetical protein
MFWTRLGTNTGVAPSGTVEEIEQFVAASKPAMLYFSCIPIDPSKIDQQQHALLRQFQDETQQKALTGTFTSIDELCRALHHHLTRKIRELAASRPKTGRGRPDRAFRITELIAKQREHQITMEEFQRFEHDLLPKRSKPTATEPIAAPEVGPNATQFYHAGVAQGRGGHDTGAVCAVLEPLAGITPRGVKVTGASNSIARELAGASVKDFPIRSVLVGYLRSQRSVCTASGWVARTCLTKRLGPELRITWKLRLRRLASMTVRSPATMASASSRPQLIRQSARLAVRCMVLHYCTQRLTVTIARRARPCTAQGCCPSPDYA